MYENNISFRLHALVYSMDKLAAQVLRAHDSYTFPQFLVVLCVYSNPSVTQKFVADWLQITEATVSYTVKRLVAAGLITIEPSSKDSRSKSLSVTKEGATFVETIYPKLEEALTPHYKKLASKQVSELQAIINVLHTSMNEGEEK